MKKNTLPSTFYKITICTFFSLLSTSVMAVPNGVYVGGFLGSSTLNVSAGSEHIYPASKHEDKLSWRVDAGYKYNPNIAIEAGYIDWAEVKFKNAYNSNFATANVKQKSVDVMGAFMFPFDAAANIYAKAGVAYAKTTRSANDFARKLGAKNNNEDAFKPIFGVGASYEFYPNLQVEVTWLKMPSGGGVPSSSFYGAGLTFFVGR